jgi:hypothetical protein
MRKIKRQIIKDNRGREGGRERESQREMPNMYCIATQNADTSAA